VGDDVADPDPRSDEELGRCIRDGDAPERVLAAFELGRRLGAGVTGELSLDAEPSSGVRRHWLTVLASFGERDAVRVIAEQHVDDDEGEHAMHLALQLGIGDPAWWADRFAGASERMRAALLERAADRVDWPAVVPALESLLASDLADPRRLAADRLLSLASHPGPSLRQYALKRPVEAAAVLSAWARGPEHRELFDVLPVYGAGFQALATAGRTYALEEVRARVLAFPASFALVRCPVDRPLLFEVTDALLDGQRWPSAPWLGELARTAGPPWDDDERGTLERWAGAVTAWTDEWEDPPQAAVLRAVGYLPPDGSDETATT
jgi:hypothetical protein